MTILRALFLPAFTAVVTAFVLVCTGVEVMPSLALAACVVWQGLGGMLIWQRIRPGSSSLEAWGAGLSIGTALAALAGLATSTVGLGPWGWLVPTAIAGAWSLIRRRRVSARPVDLPQVVAFTLAAVTGLAVLAYALLSYPLSWIGSWSGYHPDMPFFEAISMAIARFGAFDSPFMSGGLVRYHWLSYAWAGQLTVTTDAAPFVTITRVLPVVALLGCAAMVVAWTRRLSPHSWTPTLSGLLLTLGGFTGAVFGGILTMDSPSQSMSVLWLIALCILVVHTTTSNTPLVPATMLVAVLSFALVGGKVSAAAPAVAAVVLMTAVQWIRRDAPRLRVAWTAIATVGGAAAGFLFFLVGSRGGGGLTLGSLIDRASSQQGLNPIDSRYAVIAGTLILAVAVLPRWAGLAWLLTRREWRWRPEITLGGGLAASSIAALLAFNSFNEVWFSSTVSGPLAVLTAVGAGSAVDQIASRVRPSAQTLLLTGCVLAAGIFAVVWALWATGSSGGNLWVATLRWTGPVAAFGLAILLGAGLGRWGQGRLTWTGVAAGTAVLLVLVSVPGRLLGAGTGLAGNLDAGVRTEWFSLGGDKSRVGRDLYPVEEWTDSRMASAAWLRANASPTDLLATNLTFGPFVAGVTHLPTYVSALWYQSPYGPPWMQQEMLTREEQVWSFIDSPSPQTIGSLCDARVLWLWIDTARTPQRSWDPFATVLFEDSDTIIARVNDAACP